MTPDLLIEQSWKITLLIHACLILRLIRMRTRPQQFVRWVVFGFAYSFVGSLFGVKSPIYYSLYLVGQTVDVVLSFFVTQEVLEQTYASYPGLPILGNRLLRWSAFTAIGVACLAIPVTSRWWSSPYYACVGFTLAEVTRFLDLTYVIFMVAMYWRLRTLPIKLGRYTKVHGSLWLFIVLNNVVTSCVGLYIHSKRLNVFLDVYMLVQGTIAYVAWIVLFSVEPAYIGDRICTPPYNQSEAISKLARLTQLCNFVLHRREDYQ